MEKFYMEDNNNKKGRRSIWDVSIVLSFAVAIFFVATVAMTGLSVIQKTGISYAADVVEDIPSDFTFTLLNGGDRVVGSNTTNANVFNVPMYVANNDASKPIFCVQYHVYPDTNNKYTAGEFIYNPETNDGDYGLVYLLNNSYANGVSVTNATGNNAKYVEGWVTQAAIWMYLYEKDPTATQATSPNYLSTDEINGIKGATTLTMYAANGTDYTDVYNGANLYDTYIKKLVEKAKTVSDVAVLTVSKTSDEVSRTEDKKFYQSALITVTGDPSSSLKNYKIKLSGIEGAKAVGEDLQELPETITAGTKFYVRIPADKVTKDVQKVVVTVDATFSTLKGKYYTAATANKQKVVYVTAGEKVVSKGTDVEFVGTDDTGMNTVQTIYFIGLIVLLCGVGIVYANAKPVQVKQ